MGQPPPVYPAPVTADPPGWSTFHTFTRPTGHPSEWARLQVPEAGAAGYTLLYRGKFRAFQVPGTRARLFMVFCFVFCLCFVLSFYYLQIFCYFLKNFLQNICKCTE